MESGRWHASHFSWKIGAMSFVNVGFAGVWSAAPARAAVAAPIAATTGRTPSGLHLLLIPELHPPASRLLRDTDRLVTQLTWRDSPTVADCNRIVPRPEAPPERRCFAAGEAPDANRQAPGG
jgi:hypothetical protein